MSGKYFIGGLSRDTTSESLRAYFELYGELLDAVVMTKEGHSRGFGFVTFVNPTIVAPTFLQTTHVVDGKKVEVKSAIPQEEMTNQPYFYPQPISQPSLVQSSSISYPQTSSQTNKLFVGGITPQTTKEMLEAHFTQFGTVVDAVVLIDMAGRPRGFGFVSYSTPEEADNAIRWGPHIIDSRLVDVKSAEPKGSPNLVSPNPISSYQNQNPPAERVGFPPNFPYYSSPTPVVSNPLQGSTENPHSIHSKVFVGGLNRDTTEDGLIAYFGQFGTLEGCEILRRDGISRGFAFVVFEDDFVASQVLASMPHIIDGKQVELKACVPKTVDPPQKRIVPGFPAGRGLG